MAAQRSGTAPAPRYLTGAESICESLLAEGVTTAFGYPGGAILPLYDALPRYPQLRHILTRHEQGAGFAAQGYARATGQVGVCIATSGPGATNLVTALADAYMDSIPVVAITGQVGSTLLGTDAFQESDVTGITLPITKHNILVTKAADIAPALKEAFHIARTGRQGPVHVDITKDAQLGETPYDYAKIPLHLPGYHPHVTGISKSQLTAFAALIKQSKRPILIAGHGVHISGAHAALATFLQKSGIPLATTLHGRSACPASTPHYLGMVGMHGSIAANYATDRADLIIGCGIRFDDRITGKVAEFGKYAKIVHIDIDTAEHNKIVRPALFLHADAKDALTALSSIPYGDYSPWRAEISRHTESLTAQVIRERTTTTPTKKTLTGGDVVAALSTAAPKDAYIVTDVGQHQMWVSMLYNYRAPNRQITSGGLGTMGFSLPTSMGVKVACPTATVWSISGDGGFQMNIQELGCIAQEGIPVKILIMNNSYLGMVRQWQDLFHKKNYSSVSLKNPDFVALAAAYGIPGIRVTREADLLPALRRAQKAKGAFLVEAIIAAEENVFPMVPPGATLGEARAK